MRLRLFLDRLVRHLFSGLRRLRYLSEINAEGSLMLERGVVIRTIWGLNGTHRPIAVKTLGGVRIGVGTVIQGTGRLTIGARTYLNEYCIIRCNAEITIGRDVMIAPAVTIRDTDHAFERTDIPMNRQGITTGPISIGDDVWLGHGAAILKGVTIGTGAIVAAGAVVNRDVAPYDIVGGVPARVIGTRKSTLEEQP